jgi:alkylation response protein AidB-like acyl-CoA dehydrogenase
VSTAATSQRTALGEIADELRESVHAFVQARSTETEVRRLMETESGFDPAVWAQMADQLELPGMTIPERFGGSGFGLDAQAVVFEEMGRALMCAPYLSTALATEALLAAGDDAACADYLPDIASGRKRAALALLEGTGRLDPSMIETRAVDTGGGETRLEGRKKFVIDGHTAQLLVVIARDGSGLSTFVVEADAPGVTRLPVKTLDPTRKQAHITFDATPARRLGGGGGVESVLARIETFAAVAIAAESVGCASACVETSTAYAKDRYQFGRPIGSFQAIKHKCAEMLRLTEQSRAAAYEAAVRVADGGADGPLVASVAKAYCCEMAGWVAAENIQVHGGIGFTWEHSAHLYFRRAKSDEQLFGNPAYFRERVLSYMEV